MFALLRCVPTRNILSLLGATGEGEGEWELYLVKQLKLRSNVSAVWLTRVVSLSQLRQIVPSPTLWSQSFPQCQAHLCAKTMRENNRIADTWEWCAWPRASPSAWINILAVLIWHGPSRVPRCLIIIDTVRVALSWPPCYDLCRSLCPYKQID